LNAAFSEENNMPRIQRVNVALPEEQIAAMNAAVEAGEYATAGEVVRDALRDWQVKRECRSAGIERLRALWDEGLASGPMEPFDIDEIIADAKKRLPQVEAP
jgi:antitoxin ParD1/3/4